MFEDLQNFGLTFELMYQLQYSETAFICYLKNFVMTW
jgi:hypothetical protein